MVLPLIILSVFSIFFGFISKDIYIGLGFTNFIDNSIFIHPYNEIGIYTEFGILTLYKLLPFFSTLIFIIISFFFWKFKIYIDLF